MGIVYGVTKTTPGSPLGIHTNRPPEEVPEEEASLSKWHERAGLLH